ncbi:exophilin-5 isoform X2 [Rhineura floridana]|nr:exophilin-5 isoform X2 [Rhineura floridana]XP_061484630.1 exophilin-5 isoform X2 [Rhineura floridana]
MLKQPLAHRLRKATGNDSTNAKPSVPQTPQAQKNASPSILGGLRTPFASLLSSFRRSKRQHSKPPQKQPQYFPRYDHFAAGTPTSSKVEEMAKVETCDSPLPSEPANKCSDASQAEMMEDSTCTWNEQLENELLRVLGSLDDQLAQEQSRDAANRRTSIDSVSRASDTNQYLTVTPPSVLRAVHRNDRSMFLSDRTRTLRATDEHRTLFRPRMLYDAYMKRHHAEDSTCWDTYGRRSHVLKRRHSTHSLGHCSEGTLQMPSGQHSSGFGQKDFMPGDTVSRSYSLSCLARRQSLTSVDQLSPATPQHPLESNSVFAPRVYRHHPKRTPLSSIDWNPPQSPGHPLCPDKLLRTQSLMEFGPVFEDTYSCSLQENTRYEFYRTKTNYRRSVPNMNNSILADKHTDPLGLDSQENVLLHQLERNVSKPHYRYPSFHGRMNLSRKSFPSGRIEEQLFRPSGQHYYNDEVFLASDVNFKRTPTYLRNWESAFENKKALQCEIDAQSQVSEYVRSMDHSEGIINKPFLKHANSIDSCPAYDISVGKGQTEYAAQRQNPFIRAGHISSKTLTKHLQSKKKFKTPATEEMGADQLGKTDNGDVIDRTRLLSDQVDTNIPAESWMPPCWNSSANDPQAGTSLNSPLLLCSKGEGKSASIRYAENIHLSNIHNRNGHSNEDDCAINNDLDQTPPTQLTANSSRTSVLHIVEREGHPSETLGDFMPNKSSGDCSSALNKGPKLIAHDELPYSCTEKFNKHNRFARHTTSNSITGSPSNSPSKSPVMYYTLPRKSASTDGSVILEKPISSATRQNPFKNRIAVGDNLETLVSNRFEKNPSFHRAKNFLLSSSRSSLSPSPKDGTCNIPQTKDCHLLITQDPKHSVVDSNIKEKAIECSPDKTEISLLSQCEETDAGNLLKQYKTTSTLTVSIEEDNVKYHELISVYYTLPRKQSRTLCSLFLDDTQSTDSFPAEGKCQTPQKKYDVHIGLATVAFSSDLEKEEKADSPGKMAATPDLTQNSNTLDDANKEGSHHVLNSNMEKAGVSLSQSVVHKEETIGFPTETPALVFSNRVVSHGLPGDPKPSKTVDESASTTTNGLCNQHGGKLPSPLKEESKVDASLNLSSLNSADPNISLGNLASISAAMNVLKESPVYFKASTASSYPHLPSSNLITNNQEEKYAANSKIITTLNTTKERIRQDVEIEERTHYRSHIILKKGNGLQSRDKSAGNRMDEETTDEASVLGTKVHSDFQNQTLQADVASTVNPILQPNMSALEYAKKQNEMLRNSLLHKDCTNPQRSVKNPVDKRSLNSKDQLTSTAEDLPDCLGTENKLILDSTKDKACDIEKRKNRSSIKNRLAAMYKTSRKFSSKKILSPKPHISNIFSQNDAPLEISSPHSMLILPHVPPLLLQTGNENQNRNPLADEFDNMVLEKPEKKKSQTNEGSPLFTNEVRRPFTNLCNQKRESPRQSDKKTETTHSSTALFPKEIMSMITSHSQARERLEKNNCSISSRITVADPKQMKKDVSNAGDPFVFPLSSDNNSNILNKKAHMCPLQKMISPKEYDHYQNIKQSNRVRKLNLPCVEPVLNPSKTQRERHFSESSYTQEPHVHLASRSNLISHGSRYSRKFKSHSELLSCDENENWETENESNRTFGSRRVLYPSIEFGIFGKEQQQAFLDNIKRSLTEGRLWTPCLLKSPSSLRKEKDCSLSRSELLSSGFAEKMPSAGGSSPSEPVDARGEEPTDYSDSDSDTTTDDEYYLDENDKESEL